MKQKETEVEALQQELLECKNAMNSQEKTLHQKEAELRIHERSLERQKKKNEQLSAALRSKKRSRDSEIDVLDFSKFYLRLEREKKKKISVQVIDFFFPCIYLQID